jgi:glyoxylase-like metal-dependent hydrolase (beta-lactamase superfamily II)
MVHTIIVMNREDSIMKQEIKRIDLGGVNCYLVRTENGFVLFDTGGHLFMDKEFTNRYEELKEALEEAGCKEEKLRAIILTHGDNDHVANAAKLREEYGCCIAMHEKDLELVNEVTLDKMLENLNYRSLIHKIIHLFIKKLLCNLTEKTRKDYQGFLPDRYLKDGDDLSAYGIEAEVIHIPGHTDGSIGILMKDGTLICGDILANIKKPAIAPNAKNFSQLSESLKKLSLRKLNIICPGHGEPFQAREYIGFARR